MPIFQNDNRIKQIYAGENKVIAIRQGNNLLWTPRADFYSSSWQEIKNWIDNGEWKSQKWSVGDVHSLVMKDGSIYQVRILAIYDGSENSKEYKGQIDYTAAGTKPHLVLELTQCLADSYYINEEPDEDNQPQTWGSSYLKTLMSPGGEIYENLPDEVKEMIIPVAKKTGISGNTKTSAPESQESYLFPLSVQEYVGEGCANNDVNTKEGLQYQYYIDNPNLVVKKPYGDSRNVVYYTRSPMQAEGELYEYFWAIGGRNNFSIFPSYTPLNVTFAFCI